MQDDKTTALNLLGCLWCGMIHGPRCPSVKAMEYHPDGSVKRVEFFGPNDYQQSEGIVEGRYATG